MKKSLKVLFAVIACIVLMCPLFTGCGSCYGEYVKDSLDYSVSVGYIYTRVHGSFQINFKEKGFYTVSYDVNLCYGENKQIVASEHYAESVNVKDVTPKTFYFNKSFTITWQLDDDVSYSDYEVRISQTNIAANNQYDKFNGYAIGFSVTAAVLTCGITAFFIITKLREKKD